MITGVPGRLERFLGIATLAVVVMLGAGVWYLGSHSLRLFTFSAASGVRMAPVNRDLQVVGDLSDTQILHLAQSYPWPVGCKRAALGIDRLDANGMSVDGIAYYLTLNARGTLTVDDVGRPGPNPRATHFRSSLRCADDDPLRILVIDVPAEPVQVSAAP
jgi:hypothetical protein